jgi:hypothetical protein
MDPTDGNTLVMKDLMSSRDCRMVRSVVKKLLSNLAQPTGGMV